MRQNKKNQTGSALIYILIGAVLFGLLMFTLTRGNNISGSIGTTGNTKAQVQALIDYGQSVSAAVQKLISKGCSEQEISFENPVVTGYANSRSPSGGDRHCWVFDPAGGNILWKSAPSTITTYNWLYTSRICIPQTGDPVNCWSKASEADLVMLLPYITDSVCTALNKTLNYTTQTNVGGENFAGGSKFTGTFSTAAAAPDNNQNRPAACFNGDASYPGKYYFQVLIQRD